MSRTRTAIRRALVVVESPAMRRIASELEAAAETDAPVVIEGERGTGRELLARALHFAGPRCGAAFVSVAAVAAAEPLFDDQQLAAPEAGPLTRAAGGTLLVKNLCELAHDAQHRLVRLLRARRGDANDRTSEVRDVRIVGACNEDLEAAVEAGVFDGELFGLMAEHRIAVPPLRERGADIAPLASHFVREYGKALDRPRISLATRAFDRLTTYPWPGNVAELKDTAWRLAIRAKSAKIGADDVDAVIPPLAERTPLEDMAFEDMVRAKIGAFLRRVNGYPTEQLYDEVLARVERPLLQLVMEHTGGNQVRAAEILGLNRNTLRRKLTERGVRAPTKRAPHTRPADDAAGARTGRSR